MKVILIRRIKGDFPFQSTIAEPGVYEAILNPQQAVSVIASNGHELGLKPGEFEWLGESPSKWNQNGTLKLEDNK
jgi:hypothetical protein